MRERGLCWCGCGSPTPVATYTDRARGRIKGQPYRYVRGHNRRKSGAPYVIRDAGFSTPCWLWQRAVSENGYGRIGGRGGGTSAHRWYWEQQHGALPAGMELDHLCRVRSCVNPSHLEVVTHAENCRRNATTILTAEQVVEIRARVAAGPRGTQSRLAEEFGVSLSTINKIVRGTNWVAA